MFNLMRILAGSHLRLQAWSPDASIAGTPLTGFATPVFTQVDDTPPVLSAKQKTVTSMTGMGTATPNTAASPFTSTFHKPNPLKGLPAANPVTGLRASIPINQYKWIVRKGCFVSAGVPALITSRLLLDLPAGVESYNPDEVKALVAYLSGTLIEEINDLVDTLLTGTLP